jgi:heme-degrading monooxygenase HmoA
MAFLSVKHTVNSFNHWKTVYDSLEAARGQHGFIGSQILRGADNPNHVVVLEEYQTLEGAKIWAHSSDFHVANGHAGVNCVPEILFLENH